MPRRLSRWSSRPPADPPRWSSRPPAAVSRPPEPGLDTLRPQAASGYSTNAAKESGYSTSAARESGYSTSAAGDERAALARAAFGRTASTADEVRAADAALELNQLDLREASERDALRRATLDAADARERRAHRIRSRIVRVTSVLAVLGVIAAGASMMLSPPARDGEPFVDTMDLGHREVAPLPSRVPLAAVTTGSAASAERWFDAAQTNADIVDQASENIDPASTRAVTSSVEGWLVWVARDLQGNFCVIALESASGARGTACTTPEDMTAAGIVMTTSGTTAVTVFWDGFDLETTLVE